MCEHTFWEIIAQSKKNSNGNYEKQQEELKHSLTALQPIEIQKFDNKFRTLRGDAYRWELWAAAYIMNGGCSEDSFSDFRGWLIGHGKETFFNALSNPDSIAELDHEMDTDEWEGLSYVALTAFEQKTGNSLPNGIQENTLITGQTWVEDDDELKSMLPLVWAKWGFE